MNSLCRCSFEQCTSLIKALVSIATYFNGFNNEIVDRLLETLQQHHCETYSKKIIYIKYKISVQFISLLFELILFNLSCIFLYNHFYRFYTYFKKPFD